MKNYQTKLSTSARYRESIRLRWSNMHRRCKLKDSYLKKGIQVCQEWQSFDNFYQWAKSQGFQHNYSLELDRIDNNGDYSPDNCRFVDRLTNLLNRETSQPYQVITDRQEWFPSVASAAKAIGGDESTIIKCIQGTRCTHKGRSFMKLEYDILDLTPKSSQV